MILGFGNNVTSRLASDITSSQTTITIDSGSGTIFSRLLNPSISNPDVKHKVIAKITISDIEQTIWEVCHLTEVNGDTLTVIRGQEGTSQRGWNASSLIGNFATKGSEGNFVQIEHLQGGDFTYTTAKGTANDLVVNLPSTYTIDNWDLKSPIVISPINNNTGNVKIQLLLNGFLIGDFPVYKANKNQLIKNDIVAGVPFIVVLDKTKTFFNMINAGSIYDTLQLAQQPGSSTTIPLSQNAVKEYYALKTSQDNLTAGRLTVKSPSTHGYLELIAANGNTWRVGSNNNDQRGYLEKIGTGGYNVYFPNNAGTLGIQNTASKSQNGYWRCGDTGIIIQAATYKTSGNGTKTFNFPIPFPSQCMSAVASVNGISNDPDYYCFYVRAKNNQYITTYCEGIGMTDINILAMGY